MSSALIVSTLEQQWTRTHLQTSASCSALEVSSSVQVSSRLQVTFASISYVASQYAYLLFTVLLHYKVDDELVKIERVGNVSSDVEGEMDHEDGARSISGLSREFTSQILSGVRFAPLTNSRSMVQTVIPAHVWNPSVQRMYPSEFKRASMHLLMCSNSELVQPLPTTPRPDERVNVAAMLPKSIWVEILSFTHRKCKLLLPPTASLKFNFHLNHLMFILSLY